jgi:hypothetical protein
VFGSRVALLEVSAAQIAGSVRAPELWSRVLARRSVRTHPAVGGALAPDIPHVDL